MKKNYIKPGLRMEKFTVEDIITASDSHNLLYGKQFSEAGIEAEGGTITFTSGNTLNSINYAEFLN